MAEAGFRRRCQVFGWLMTGAAAVLALVLVVEAIGWTRHAPTVADLVQWSRYRMAVPVYLVAVAMLARLLQRMGRGDARGMAVPRTIAWVGALLTAGALVTVFGPSMLVRIATGRAEIASFDVSAITLGVAGIGLWLLADVLKRGEAARAELAEFL